MAKVDPKQLVGKEIGKSGTTVSSGVITGEDYNYKLSGKQALKEYERMRRSDATVRAALQSIVQPIKSAAYEVDPASDSGRDKKVASLVKHCLFEEVDWRKFLGEALTYLPMGFSLFEKRYEPITWEGATYIGLTKLAYRKQTTVDKWETQDRQLGITQMVDGKQYSIPIELLVRFTNEQEGDNYEGLSILRSSYQNWYIKSKLYKIDAVAHEKHALGVLDISYPKGTSQDAIKAARKAARNMRANEQSYIDHPEEIKFAFLDMKANTLRDIKPSIDHHDRQITKNVLAQFLELGGTGGGSGSRAVSEDHSRLFAMAVQAVADHIVRVLQDYVVKQLVDLNFSDVTDYPKLRVEKISDENIQVMSEALAKLIPAGIIHPRPADENSVRKVLGLAQVDDAELKDLFEAEDVDVKDDEAAELKAARVLATRIEQRLYDQSRAA